MVRSCKIGTGGTFAAVWVAAALFGWSAVDDDAGSAATTVQESGQEARIAGSSVAISSDEGGRAALELRLAEDGRLALALEGGEVRVDERVVGRYEVGGDLEAAWRDLLRSLAGRETADLADRLLAWEPEGLSGAEAGAFEAMRSRLAGALAPPEAPEAPADPATVQGPEGRSVSIAPGARSFEALTAQLETLHESLDDLGNEAAAATEELALVVHDDYAVGSGQVVEGNLALLDGRLRLAGTVRGDVLVLDGVLELESGGVVEGDVLQVGGEIDQLGGRLGGELLSMRDVGAAAAERARDRSEEVRERIEESRAVAVERRDRDRGFFGHFFHNVGHAIDGLAGALSAFIGLGLLGLLTVYFARPRLERVADAAREEFGRSVLAGLAGEVLFIPVFVILCVAVITIPLALLLVPLSAVAVLGGYLAVCHSLGEMFAARRYRYEWLERLRRSNSYYYVLTGLGLLLLPFALASALWLLGGLAGFLRGLTIFAAVVVTWLATTTGFGAVLLTRGGSRAETGMPWDSSPSPSRGGRGRAPGGRSGSGPGQPGSGPGQSGSGPGQPGSGPTGEPGA